MEDLAQWLHAQLDEDKRIVRAATWCEDAATWHAEPSPFGAREKGQRWYVEDAMDDGVVSHVDPVASDDEGVARHIAEWDPARVLREIDSKRRIIDAYETTVRAVVDLRAARERLSIKGHDTLMTDLDLESAIHKRDALQGVLRLLALPYDDRPGFQESWRP